MLRGGYSIFYNGSSYPQIATQMAAQPPFARTASLSTSLDDPLTIQNGFRSAVFDDHQHLRDRPELPPRLRANLDVRAAAHAAARRGHGIRIHRGPRARTWTWC